MKGYQGIAVLCCIALLYGCHPDFVTIKQNSTLINREPTIQPNYAGITIPPNIAPMHFSVQDSCTACVAEITSNNSASVIVWGNKNRIYIKTQKWKRLLAENRGTSLHITIYVKNNHDEWNRYAAIKNSVALEPVDPYCTYRLLSFQYSHSRELRICQRDLTTFNETILMNTQNYELDCVNCHMPNNNNPRRFVLQARSRRYGNETLIAIDDSITTLTSHLGHTAWHPGNRYIAFTVYKVQQYFHAVGRQLIDVYDNYSRIVIYDVHNKKIIPVPQLARKGVLETWPAWSPDGCYLYFSSASVPWDDYDKEPPENFNKTRYSLMCIAYDTVSNRWGAVDTVLSSDEVGGSIVQPKLSPDNKFCLFCIQEYGAYPHSQASSDLYLMDIASRNYRKLSVNSEFNESWHSWSHNSRWILFASKRNGGIFTRLYMSYIDSTGNAHTPFLLPQRDPSFYNSFIYCYNVPEFATGPIRFTEQKLLKAIKSHKTLHVPVSTD